MTALREGAVSHAFDKMLFVPDKEELSLHADGTKRAELRCDCRRRARRNLFGIEHCHQGSSRDGRSGGETAGGAALA